MEQPKDATLRVRPETHTMLKELASSEHLPLTQYLERLTEEAYRRKQLEDCNAAFTRLRSQPAAWADYQADLAATDGTAADGLDDDDTGVTAGDQGLWEFAEAPPR